MDACRIEVMWKFASLLEIEAEDFPTFILEEYGTTIEDLDDLGYLDFLQYAQEELGK